MLGRDSNNPAAQILLAQLKITERDFPGAPERYRKALQAEPQDAAVLNNVAYLLVENIGQTDAALGYAQRAVELNPASPDYAATYD